MIFMSHLQNLCSSQHHVAIYFFLKVLMYKFPHLDLQSIWKDFGGDGGIVINKSQFLVFFFPYDIQLDDVTFLQIGLSYFLIV